jgi:hypothetical protein
MAVSHLEKTIIFENSELFKKLSDRFSKNDLETASFNLTATKL